MHFEDEDVLHLWEGAGLSRGRHAVDGHSDGMAEVHVTNQAHHLGLKLMLSAGTLRRCPLGFGPVIFDDGIKEGVPPAVWHLEGLPQVPFVAEASLLQDTDRGRVLGRDGRPDAVEPELVESEPQKERGHFGPVTLAPMISPNDISDVPASVRLVPALDSSCSYELAVDGGG